jgi:hypothetical protein
VSGVASVIRRAQRGDAIVEIIDVVEMSDGAEILVVVCENVERLPWFSAM